MRPYGCSACRPLPIGPFRSWWLRDRSLRTTKATFRSPSPDRAVTPRCLPGALPSEGAQEVERERNVEEAEQALAEVRQVAEGEGNLLPPMRKALRARVTIGEICNELRDVFGTYDAQRRPA